MGTRHLGLVTVGFLLVACGGGGGKTAPPSPGAETTPSPAVDRCQPATELVMEDNHFVPECVEVSKGDTLTIRNEGQNLHSLTADEAKVDFDVRAGKSKAFDVGSLKRTKHRFNCKYHSGMLVDVVVV